jgi:hypothetical protein
MVEIARVNGGNVVLVGNGGYSIDVGSIRHLPPAMTEAEKALIKHVIGVDWRGSGGQIENLYNAVLADRAPPDPVEVAWEAADNSGREPPPWFRTALKAYDAAKEKS